MDGDLLDRLVGKWKIEGRMRDRFLHQVAEAGWVLQNLFLEVRFRAVQVGEGGNPPYEAIYLLGYDKKSRQYVLNLFDTFGVSVPATPGIGMRDGNTIRFEFRYPSGLFVNEFIWHSEADRWTMVLTDNTTDEPELFAEKELTRIV